MIYTNNNNLIFKNSNIRVNVNKNVNIGFIFFYNKK